MFLIFNSQSWIEAHRVRIVTLFRWATFSHVNETGRASRLQLRVQQVKW